MKEADKIWQDILSTIKQTMAETTDKMKDILHEESEYIYREYRPEFYLRRYELDEEGAFGDEDVIHGNAKPTKDGFVVTVSNDSKAVGDDRGDYLDTYIEKGIYDWFPSPTARPFAFRANNRIQKTDEVTGIIKNALRNKGYNIED